MNSLRCIYLVFQGTSELYQRRSYLGMGIAVHNLVPGNNGEPVHTPFCPKQIPNRNASRYSHFKLKFKIKDD